MNAVDIAIVVLLVASGVFALIRGFVHEVLAMAGWVAAPIAAVWTLPWTTPFAQRFVTNPLMAKIAAGVVVFLVVLLALSVITHAVAGMVQKSALGSVDRSLGFVFGLARGLILCSLSYMVVTWLLPTLPESVQNARLLPLLTWGQGVIKSLLPEEVEKLENTTTKAANTLGATGQSFQQLDNVGQTFNQLKSPQPAAPSTGAQAPNYDTQGLNRLIQNTNGK